MSALLSDLPRAPRPALDLDSFQARWERATDTERAVVDFLAAAAGPFADDAECWQARMVCWERQYLPVYGALQDAEVYLVDAMHHTLLQILAGAVTNFLDAPPHQRQQPLQALRQAHDAFTELREGQKEKKRKRPARQPADNASATTGQRAHLKPVQRG